MPESAQIAGLPAFDRFGGLFVAGIGGELVFESPPAHTGAIGNKVQALVEFAGPGAVRGRRLGGEELDQHGEDGGRPVGAMVTAGGLRGPGAGLTLGASPQVVGAELVEAAGMDVQFEGRGLDGEATGADFSEEMADERGGQTMGELLFFMATQSSREVDFSPWN